MASLLNIEQWKDATTPTQGDKELPLAASVFVTCDNLLSALFTSIHKQTGAKQASIRSIQRSHGLMVLWANECGVLDGRLDDLWDNFPRARDLTLQPLQSICRLLSGKLPACIPSEDQPWLSQNVSEAAKWAERLRFLEKHDNAWESDLDPDCDSDSDSSRCSSPVDDEYELEETAKDLATDVYGLVRLGTQFEKSEIGVVAQETALSPELVSDWHPSHYFSEFIRHRYPQCNIDLAKCLGRANWNRWERRIRAMDSDTENENTKPGNTRTKDSALGSSIPTATLQPPPSTHAETVQTYFRDKNEDNAVKIPPLTDGAKMGIPFPCVGCGKSVVFRETRKWKKHLLLDLQPYVCTIDGCINNSLPFGDKGQWIAHMLQKHDSEASKMANTCPLCKDQINGSNATLLGHISKHMEEISLTIIPFSEDPDEENLGILDKRHTFSNKLSSSNAGSQQLFAATGGEAMVDIPEREKEIWGDLDALEGSAETYTCPYCSEEIPKSLDMRTHLEKNHPERYVVAKAWDVLDWSHPGWTQKYDARSTEAVNGDPETCYFCRKEYHGVDAENSLLRHYRKHPDHEPNSLLP